MGQFFRASGPMTVRRILELLDQAMASEQEFIAEFVRRDELWRAAQAQARFQALEAFRKAALKRLAGKGKLDA